MSVFAVTVLTDSVSAKGRIHSSFGYAAIKLVYNCCIAQRPEKVSMSPSGHELSAFSPEVDHNLLRQPFISIYYEKILEKPFF